MRMGFTGTRRGMTQRQKEAFCDLLWRLRPEEFHHGACVGADEEAAFSIHLCSFWHSIVAHPGKSSGGGTSCRSEVAVSVSDAVRPEQTHFARNRTIVACCDRLVAMPWQAKEEGSGPREGGGTWYTIRHALKVGRPVTIIWPDGSVEERERRMMA